MNTTIKFYPRLNIWKNSSGSLVYNEQTKVSYSYNWYKLSDKIKNKVILNSYRYSVTTASQVRCMREKFNKENTAFIEIEAPRGLGDLSSSYQLYQSRLVSLNEKLNKPRIRKTTIAKIKQDIKNVEQKIKLVQKLMKA